ncbi:iron chelate uptake ABC transporter family permease subunit, partial [Candidatus Latescibacterota bacterium]
MKRKHLILGMVMLFSAVILVGAPLIGIEPVDITVVFNAGADTVQADIFWKIRIPRVLTAFLAGAALAVSGMTFQALFRNPLASPFTLGVSSGAAFGAAVYLKLGLLFSFLGLSGSTISAFTGALLSIGIVWGIAGTSRG